MLSCQDLRCRRDEHTLFEEVGFTLYPGSVLQIQGPNGSGKSTLLAQCAGLLPLEQGSIQMKGMRLPLAYIGHQQGLRAEDTVLESLLLWAEIWQSETALAAAVHYFQLAPWIDHRCDELSAGLRQRVALAKLLVWPTDVWILDEPEVHLDAQGREQLEQLIASKANQGGIILWATHSTTTLSQDIPSLVLNLKEVQHD
jgi:heme exporter protein A